MLRVHHHRHGAHRWAPSRGKLPGGAARLPRHLAAPRPRWRLLLQRLLMRAAWSHQLAALHCFLLVVLHLRDGVRLRRPMALAQAGVVRVRGRHAAGA